MSYQSKLEQLNGVDIDNEFGISQNLFNIGITDNEVFSIQTKENMEGTLYHVELINGEKFVLYVDDQTQKIEF